MKRWLRNNGLSVTFVILFVLAMFGQTLTGMAEHNKELKEHHQPEVSIRGYLTSGHFIQATFENWESEFLQMALFVVFTIFLRQKGSSESKSFDEEEEVDRTPDPGKKDAPWPVRKGGFWLSVYKNSLTIALVLLFIASLVLHLYGSLKDENQLRVIKGEPAETWKHYITQSRFWFESFQNWQSEFLSVFSIIVLSIFLRQQGSSQSKPVDAADSETGE